jgi:nicotinate-nucleotide adenylyltransferase
MIVGILGGTFDPPHLGHLGVARAALESGQVAEVWLVPCVRHALGKEPTGFDHRLAMCRLLVDGDPRIAVSQAEADLPEPGKTLELVLALERAHPSHEFRLIAGADIFHERHKWHRYDEVARRASPIYVARAGVAPIPEPTLPAPIDVSSSEVRALLERCERPTRGVPASILDYIEQERLYGWCR